MKLNPLYPLLLTLLACQPSDPQIERQFQAILAANGNDAQVFYQESITEQSLAYFDALLEVSDSLNYERARTLGMDYGLPLVTMRLHGQMLSYGSYLGLGAERWAREGRANLLLLMKLTATGILEPERTDRFRFKELSSLRGDAAEVKVATDTRREAKIISTYRMERTGSLWRLNFLSTLTLEEKLLRQLVRQQGLREQPAVFMENFVAHPPEEIEFRYRQGRQ
ncbi:MAG: hypothetical protein AAFW73_21560 [Bacteroidota bacterium]